MSEDYETIIERFHDVPVVRATPQSLDGYGALLSAVPVMHSRSSVSWQDNICHEVAGSGSRKLARYNDGYIYIRSAKRSLTPVKLRGTEPFLVYLAKSVNPDPGDFVAFMFKEYEGVEIRPYVWYQQAISYYPTSSIVYEDATVSSTYDSVLESGIWLRIRAPYRA